MRLLLFAQPAFRGGKAATFSRLQGPAISTAKRPALLHAAASFFTIPSYTESIPNVTSQSSAASLNGEVASNEGGVTTTMSRCAAEKTAQGWHVFEIAEYNLHRGISVGNCIKSTLFSVGGYDWCIEFYPDGKFIEDDDSDSDNYSDYSDSDSDEDEEDDGDGYISVFVTLMSTKHNVSVRALCDLSLVNPASGLSPWTHRKKKPHSFVGDFPSWGFAKFKRRSDLESSEYLRDDCLRIHCDNKVITAMPVTQSKVPCDSIHVPPSDLLQDLRKLFLEAEKKVDVTFKVKDEVFHAHKIVLTMRAPFFDAALDAQRVGGSKRQCVTIEDDMEPGVFKALLHFIYTDSLPAMDHLDGHHKVQQVQSLLAAADKCGMERMKLMCASILCKGIEVENVAVTLALADQHHCSQLKDACIGFINSADRLRDVMASPGYECLKIASPGSIVELWEKSAKWSRNF